MTSYILHRLFNLLTKVFIGLTFNGSGSGFYGQRALQNAENKVGMLSFRPNLFDLRLNVEETHACVGFEVHSQEILWHTPSGGGYSITADDLRNFPFHVKVLSKVRVQTHRGNLTSCTPWLIIRVHPYLSALGAAPPFVSWFVIHRTLGVYIYNMFLRRCVFVICGYAFNCWISAAVRRWPRVTDQNSSETKGVPTGALHTGYWGSSSSDTKQPRSVCRRDCYWQ